MKRELKIIVLSLTLLLGLCSLNVSTAQAAKVKTDKFYQKIGNTEKAQKFKNRTFVSCYVNKKGYQLLISQRGKKQIFITSMEKYMYTNGRYLVYATDFEARGKETNIVYRMDMNTGRKTQLMKGTKLTVRGAYGNYIYYGTDQDTQGIDMYAYDLKKKTSRHMVAGSEEVKAVTDQMVVVTHHANDVDNYMAYRFKPNGTAKKKLFKAQEIYVKNGFIYWTSIDDVNYSDTLCLRRCNYNLKKCTYITDYVSYEEMTKVLKHYRLSN
ncbi:hypothetical protein lbkm_1724 [Lachnospiraceae bacterium KM106-2]|nr:hypothetical protein lbkm_1724 [Lachnospiraceae bacterium KM106-2]